MPVRSPISSRPPFAVRSSIGANSHMKRVRDPTSMNPSLTTIGRPNIARLHAPT